MKHRFVITPYRCLPCAAREFTVDGKPAAISDFGDFVEHPVEDTEDGTPCDKSFVAKTYGDNRAVARRYGLDEKAYTELADLLTEKFHVGYCCLCL